MRRTRITFLAMALLAIAPASALARGHHQRSHRHHVRHTRIERFGDTRPSGDTAGMITSFTNGVLEITLADGSTVRGRVTGDTEIECMGSVGDDMARDGGGDQSGDGSGDQGDDQRRGDDDGTEDNQTCSMEDLASGVVVHEAELGISRSGAAWRKIELGA